MLRLDFPGCLLSWILALLICSPAIAQQNDAHPGKAIYDRTCAGCHNNPEATRAPALSSLRQLHRGTVEYAITIGYMRMQASSLSAQERGELLDWLSLGQKQNANWFAAAQCSGKSAEISAAAPVIAPTFGLSASNLRRQNATDAGLKTADFARLELAWAIAFPQTPSMRSQPVIAGNTLFIAATDSGRIFAVDTRSGCMKWQFESKVPLRSSLSYGSLAPDRPVIVAGDAVGAVVAIDALTGKQLWRSEIRLHEANRITGTPVIHKGRVFAPLSGVEISYARLDTYECCKAQGAVVALDLKTGRQLWVGRTMDPATPQKRNRAGAQLWGPSGAPIWSTPAIDEKRNVLYVGTGENNSLPVTETSDAIIAFDLDTGNASGCSRRPRETPGITPADRTAPTATSALLPTSSITILVAR